MQNEPLLEIRELSKSFQCQKGNGVVSPKRKFVLKQVSYDIFRGETIALVGESGSGKTTLGQCLLRLIPSDGGQVIYQGIDLFKLKGKNYRRYRPKFQMIFQNPEQSLNPRQTILSSLLEVVKHRYLVPKSSHLKIVRELTDLVQFPLEALTRYPAQLSGGQRQRAAIARALATRPLFLAADEPTSSLDANLKWRISNLLLELKKELQLTLLLITHDLALAAFIADRVAVMYRGEIIEISPAREFFGNPLHIYSKTLLQASEETPGGFHPGFSDDNWHVKPKGNFTEKCAFYADCTLREEICNLQKPLLRNYSGSHLVACHRAGSGQEMVTQNFYETQR